MSWDCTAYFLDARATSVELLTERILVLCVYAAHACPFNYKSDCMGALTAFVWDVTAACLRECLRRNRPSYFIVMESSKLHEKKIVFINWNVIKLNKEKKRKSQNCPHHPHCPNDPINKTAPSPNINTFSLLNSFLYFTFLLCVCQYLCLSHFSKCLVCFCFCFCSVFVCCIC